MERITIYPSKELKDKLDETAKEDERSLNYIIIKILKKFFKLQNGQHTNRKT